MQVAPVTQVVGYKVGQVKPGPFDVSERAQSFQEGISSLIDVDHDPGRTGARIGKSQRWVGAEANLSPLPATVAGVAVVATPNALTAAVGARRKDNENQTRIALDAVLCFLAATVEGRRRY
jgi:hypothetical protein